MCASEERNIEEVRHKIKVSNHSAIRLLRFWQKPNQGHCLLSVAMDTTPSCQTGTCKTRWTGDYFVMTCSSLTPQPPITMQTARPPHFNWKDRKVTVRDLLWLKELWYKEKQPVSPKHTTLQSKLPLPFQGRGDDPLSRLLPT